MSPPPVPKRISQRLGELRLWYDGSMEAMTSYNEQKLSYQEQIDRLKYYGVNFEAVSEDEAIRFLTNNTYYAKIRNYLSAFEKYQEPERSHVCCHVDFVHLMSLSRLDFHLRKLIISLSLDLEHTMKTLFIQHLTNDPTCDGYQMVGQYFDANELSRMVVEGKKSAYTNEIADRFDREENIWNLIELLSFSGFMRLLEKYSSDHDDVFQFDHGLLRCARYLRNAAAHNNCLLHTLNLKSSSQVFRSSKDLGLTLANTLRVKSKHRKRILSIPVYHDLAASWFLLAYRASPGITYHRLTEFQKFFDYFASLKDQFQQQLHICVQIEDMRFLLRSIQDYATRRQGWEEK